jgi:hypothetical protein
VLDLEIAECGLGVSGLEGRDMITDGEWKAKVMNNASDLRTSWLRFEVTRVSNAPMKWGMESSDIISPFIASRSLLTIPNDN